jgi:hypothetical protein
MSAFGKNGVGFGSSGSGGGGTVPNLQQVTNVGNIIYDELYSMLVSADLLRNQDLLNNNSSYFSVESVGLQNSLIGSYVRLFDRGVTNDENDANKVFATDGSTFSLSKFAQFVFNVNYSGNVAPITLGNLFSYTNPSTGATRFYRVSINVIVTSITVGTTFKIQSNYIAFTGGYFDLIPSNSLTAIISANGFYTYTFCTSIDTENNLIVKSVAVAGVGAIVYDYCATVEFLKDVYFP